MIIPVLFFYSILVYMSRLLLLICVLSCLSSALVINSPEERIYYHQRGSFANFITNTSIHNSVLHFSSLISLIVSIASLNATVVLADPIYACEPLKINATGKFVLAKRNDDLSPTQCTFATKVKNVWSLNSSICCRFVQSFYILSNIMSMFFKCPFILIEWSIDWKQWCLVGHYHEFSSLLFWTWYDYWNGLWRRRSRNGQIRTSLSSPLLLFYRLISQLFLFAIRMDPNLYRLSNETKPPPLSIPAGMVRFSRYVHFLVELGDTDLTSVTAMMAIVYLIE